MYNLNFLASKTPSFCSMMFSRPQSWPVKTTGFAQFPMCNSGSPLIQFPQLTFFKQPAQIKGQHNWILGLALPSTSYRTSLLAQQSRIHLPMQKTWVWSLGQEDPMEKEVAIHPSILVWRMPWKRSLVPPWGGKESDTTKGLTLSLSYFLSMENRIKKKNTD